MKLNQMAMLSLAVILFTTTVSALTVTTDKSIYNQGDTVQITTKHAWTRWARVMVLDANTNKSVFYASGYPSSWSGYGTYMHFNWTIPTTVKAGYYYVDGRISTNGIGHHAISDTFYINQKPVLKEMSDKQVIEDKEAIYELTSSDYFGSNVKNMVGDNHHTYKCDMDYHGTFNPKVTKVYSVSAYGKDEITTHFQYTYHEPGTYTVACKVYDAMGQGSSLKTFKVTVLKYTPTTINSISIPNSIEEGTTLTLSAVVSPGTDTTLSTYTWKITKDGTVVKTLSGESPSYTFASSGVYVIKLTVTDSDGNTAVKTKAITVTEKEQPVEQNYAPSNLEIDGSCSELSCVFSGSADDLNGDALTYSWEISQNGETLTTLTGQDVSYDFEQAGNYKLTLTVSDGKATSTKTRYVTVESEEEPVTPSSENNAPTCEIDVQCADLTCSFIALKYDADKDPLTTAWNLGDGTLSNEPTVMHDYAESGNYIVTLTVSDGQEECTDTAIVEVTGESTPVEPETNDETGITIDAGELVRTQANTPVEFTGTADDSDGYIISFAWDFDGDGTYDVESINPIDANYTYTVPGIYHAVFKVVDNDSNVKTMERVIMVGEEQGVPTVNAGDDLTAETLENVNFLGTGEDSDGYIVKYEWDFDYDSAKGFEADYTSMRDGSASHIYYKAGAYTAAFRVTDNDGKTATDYITVTITGEDVNESDMSGIKEYSYFEMKDLSVVRESNYDPKTALTTVELKVTNLENKDRTFLIRDIVPKSAATYYDQFQVIPSYDVIYKADPELGWNVTIGAYETIEIKYTFNKFISAENMSKEWEAPTIIEQTEANETATEQPEQTNQNGLTGLVIGAMDAAGISTTALAIIVVLAIIVWKKEVIVEKLRRE